MASNKVEVTVHVAPWRPWTAPCPCCKGEAVVIIGRCAVLCTGCGLDLEAGSVDGAVMRWNTRAGVDMAAVMCSRCGSHGGDPLREQNVGATCRERTGGMDDYGNNAVCGGTFRRRWDLEAAGATAERLAAAALEKDARADAVLAAAPGDCVTFTRDELLASVSADDVYQHLGNSRDSLKRTILAELAASRHAKHGPRELNVGDLVRDCIGLRTYKARIATWGQHIGLVVLARAGLTPEQYAEAEQDLRAAAHKLASPDAHPLGMRPPVVKP